MQDLKDCSEEKWAVKLLRTNKGLMKNYQNKIKPSRLGEYIKNYRGLVSVPFLAQTKMFFCD